MSFYSILSNKILGLSDEGNQKELEFPTEGPIKFEYKKNKFSEFYYDFILNSIKKNFQYPDTPNFYLLQKHKELRHKSKAAGTTRIHPTTTLLMQIDKIMPLSKPQK